MTVKNLNLSTDEVSQTIDLADVFGFDVSRDQGLIQAFSQDAIDLILKRTQSGKDVNGGSFAPYSESYKGSLEFAAFGKSSNVDMTLSGEMLGVLEILNVEGSRVTFGLTGENAAKAYGHITGMKGHPTLDGVTPKREWFGVSEADLKRLAGAYRPSRESTPIESAIESNLVRILAGLFGE